MALTRTEAHWVVQAAVAKAQERTVTISVAMCDTGGTLCAVHRIEGASAVSATVAHEKAAASVGCRRPRSTVAADATVLLASIATLGGPAQGAVPVDKHGALVGSRGGSGAMGHQDEACAHAGGAALERLHNGDMARAYCTSLILMRVAPSGCVLSTVRWALDVNYQPLVVADACFDVDPRCTEC